jgi:hypothetical protein
MTRPQLDHAKLEREIRYECHLDSSRSHRQGLCSNHNDQEINQIKLTTIRNLVQRNIDKLHHTLNSCAINTLGIQNTILRLIITIIKDADLLPWGAD